MSEENETFCVCIHWQIFGEIAKNSTMINKLHRGII